MKTFTIIYHEQPFSGPGDNLRATVVAEDVQKAFEKFREEHPVYESGEVLGDCVVGVHEVKQNGKPLEVPVHLVGECAVADGPKTTPEFRLAAFWRSRAGIEYSEFDRLIGEESPVHDKKKPVLAVSRQSPIDFDLNPDFPDPSREATAKRRERIGTRLYDQIDATREYTARGLPLSRREYYMALAMGYIMGDRPYEEFFQTRWFETEKRCGFGSYDENKDT